MEETSWRILSSCCPAYRPPQRRRLFPPWPFPTSCQPRVCWGVPSDWYQVEFGNTSTPISRFAQPIVSILFFKNPFQSTLSSKAIPPEMTSWASLCSSMVLRISIACKKILLNFYMYGSSPLPSVVLGGVPMVEHCLSLWRWWRKSAGHRIGRVDQTFFKITQVGKEKKLHRRETTRGTQIFWKMPWKKRAWKAPLLPWSSLDIIHAKHWLHKDSSTLISTQRFVTVYCWLWRTLNMNLSL